MSQTAPPKTTHTDPSSLNVRTIVAALQAIEQAGVSTGSGKIAEMPLGDLILALKEVGVNVVSPDNARKTDNAKPALTAGALARRKAIEDVLMKLNTVDHEKHRLTTTPVDVSDFTDPDFSDFEDSLIDDVIPRTTVGPFSAPATSVRPSAAGDTGPSAAAGGTGPSAAAGNRTTGPSSAAGTTGPSSAAGTTSPSSAAVDGNVTDVEEPAAPSGYTSGTFSSGGHLKGFVCFNCKAYSTIVGGSDAWYAVAKGKSVGVFRGWDLVAPLVVGVSRSTFTRHDTRAEAEEVYQTAVRTGNVEVRPY